jgi:uncharacterized membrane protein HdeD (DUF308 family)
MSTAASVNHELHPLRKYWWCFLMLGIALVVSGTLAIADPWVTFFTTVAAVQILGFLLLASGIIQIVTSFWAGKWSGMLFHILMGVLYLVAGVMILDDPKVSMVMLTKLIAFFLIFSGAASIVSALAQRFQGWGWVLLNGGISLLLGFIIVRQMPEAALWVIGLFIGIELLFKGWGWIMLSLGLRAATKNS